MSEVEIIDKLLDVITDLADVSIILLSAVQPDKLSEFEIYRIKAKLDDAIAIHNKIESSLLRL